MIVQFSSSVPLAPFSASTTASGFATWDTHITIRAAMISQHKVCVFALVCVCCCHCMAATLYAKLHCAPWLISGSCPTCCTWLNRSCRNCVVRTLANTMAMG